MDIFVTGGSGFLGSRVIARLIEDGHNVTALARSRTSVTAVEELGARAVHGSLQSISDWQEALDGIDAVVHLAAVVVTWGPWEIFERTIADCTLSLAHAAESHRVKSFIYISSESVMQSRHPLLDVNEETPLPRFPSSYYGRAKQMAERGILEFGGSMRRIVLRPTFIWGRNSKQLAEIIDRARARRFPWIDRGRATFEHVHVDNVVDAIVLALQKGRDGRVYLITNGEPMPVRSFFAPLFTTAGTPPPSLSLPSRILYPTARALEALWRGLHLPGRPPLIRFEIEFLALSRRYDISRARAELDYEPRVRYTDALAAFNHT